MADGLVWRIDWEQLPKDPADILLTRSQAVRILRRRADSLVAYLGERGRVPRMRLGRVWAYPLSGLLAYAKDKGVDPDLAALPERPVTAGTIRGYPRDLLGAKDASILLGVEPTAGYLRKLRRDGEVRGYWLLSEHGYSQADVEALVAA